MVSTFPSDDERRLSIRLRNLNHGVHGVKTPSQVPTPWPRRATQERGAPGAEAEASLLLALGRAWQPAWLRETRGEAEPFSRKPFAPVPAGRGDPDWDLRPWATC